VGTSDLGGALAVVCTISGRVIWGQLVVDSVGTPWWTSIDVVPAGRYDLWSAAAQEAGHINGFLTGGAVNNPGHWPESDSTLCGDPGSSTYTTRETVCERLFDGTRIMRNPATHDSHTFDGAYPP
jgi:hypothetical protein